MPEKQANVMVFYRVMLSLNNNLMIKLTGLLCR